MGSLRFPFSLPQPPKPPHGPALRRAAGAFGAGVGLGIFISLKLAGACASKTHREPCGDASASSPVWAALSLVDRPPQVTYVYPGNVVIEFPAIVDGGRRLAGAGVRLRRPLFPRFNYDISYAYGVYADDGDIKRLNEKYGSFPVSELKGNKEFIADVLDQGLRMTVRLQIVRRLKVSALRKAFANAVGSGLQKFNGPDNKELLNRFTSLFADEYELQKGSVIHFSREHGHILQIRIDGKEVGKIQSKPLCKSVFDLYFGEDAYDKQAQEDIQSGLASMLQERSK